MFTKRVNFKIAVMLLTLISVINIFFWDTVFADVPQQIFFQAKLSKRDQTTVSGSHSVVFRLYSASTGGSSLWTETQDLTADSSGVISGYLGSSTSFPSTIDFNSTYYLSTEVDSDGEMSPRIKLVPALSALNSDRFDGLNSTQFLRSDTADTMEAALYILGNVGIGTTAPVGLLQAGTSPSPGLLVTAAGNLGIGTTLPAQKLHVEGQCVTGDTLLPIIRIKDNGSWIMDNETNPQSTIHNPLSTIQYIPITDVKPGDHVLSLNEETEKIEPQRINGLLDMGVKPVFKLTTADGRTIRTTGNHPYLVKGNNLGEQERETIALQRLQDLQAKGLMKEELSAEKEFAQPKFVWKDLLSEKGKKDAGNRTDDEPILAKGENKHPFDHFSSQFAIFFSQPSLKFFFYNFESMGMRFFFNFIQNFHQSFCSRFSQFFSQHIWNSNYTHNPSLGLTKYLFVRVAPSVFNFFRQALFITSREKLVNIPDAKIESNPRYDSNENCIQPLHHLYFKYSTYLKDLSSSFFIPPVFASIPKYMDNFDASWLRVIYLQEGDEIAVYNAPSSKLQAPGFSWSRISSIEYIGYERVYDIEVQGTHNFVAGHWITQATKDSGSWIVDSGTSPSSIIHHPSSSAKGRFFGGIIAHNTYMSGNVGIGTTLPVALFQVGTSPNAGLVVTAAGSVAIGGTSPTGRLDIRGDEVRIWTGTGTNTNALASGELYVEGDLEVDGTLYTSSQSVTGNSTPSADATYDLGSSILRWRDLWLSRNAFIASNVGIGTTAPQGLLHAGTAPSSGLIVQASGKVGIGTTNPTAGLTIGSGTNTNATSANDLYVSGNLEVDGSTWLGDAAADTLTVTGTFTATGADMTTGNLTVNGNTILGDAAGDTLTIKAATLSLNSASNLDLASSTTGLNIETGLLNLDSSNSRVGIGTTAPAQALDIAASAANLTLSHTTGPHQIITGGTTDLGLMPGGNLGIGSTNPVQKLQVAGDVNIESGSGIRINNTATSGQYLRGDGTRFVSAAIQAGDLPSSFSGLADPSATIGLTAVNGTATTAMRSDAAPALSQGIVPTWTGTHTFSNATYSALFSGGNVGVGTTAPTLTKLQVIGKAIITENVTADADGTIYIGRDDDATERDTNATSQYIMWDDDLVYGNKTGWLYTSGGLSVASLKVRGNTSIIFGSADQTVTYSTTGGADGTGAFTFSKETVVQASSPAYLSFVGAGGTGPLFSLKFNPDVTPKTLSLVQVDNPTGGANRVETTLFEVGAGGRLGLEFVNLVKNASFESFSALEEFHNYDPTFATTSQFGGSWNTTSGFQGGWDNFAPDEWTWVAGDVFQHSPNLLTTSVSQNYTTDAFHGKSAVSLKDPTLGSNYTSLTQAPFPDGAIKQTLTNLKPSTIYAIRAKALVTNASNTTAKVDVDGEDATAGPLTPMGSNTASALSTATATTYTDLIGTFKTDSSASNVTVYLICQQASGAVDADKCRFDALQVVAGKSAPEFAPNTIVDTGDQTLYGSLRLGRTSDEKGGILSVDKFVRSRGIELFTDDPGLSGTMGGATATLSNSGIFPPGPGYNSQTGVQAAATLYTAGTYSSTAAQNRQYKVVIDSTTTQFTWSYMDETTNWTYAQGGTGVAVSTSSASPTTLNAGVQIYFNSGSRAANDTWYFSASNQNQFTGYNSYAKNVSYTPGTTRIYKDPDIFSPYYNKLVFQDGTLKVSLNELSTSVQKTGSISTPTASNSSSALNLLAHGTYSGTASANYTVTIDSLGVAGTSASTFKWQKDGGALTANVSITGADQALSDGIYVQFNERTADGNSTINATALDSWTFNATPSSTATVKVDSLKTRVNSVDGSAITGHIRLVQGSNIALSQSANDITIAASGQLDSTIIGLVQSTAAGNSYFMGGNLGVGTSTPTALLSVGSTGAFKVTSTGAVTSATLDTGQGANELYGMDQNVLISSTPTFAGLYTTTGNLGIGTTGPAAKFEVIGAGTGTGFALRVKDSASADKLALLDSGKLGIGTTLPAAGLTIGTGTNNNATSVNDLYVTGNLEVDGSSWLGNDAAVDNITITGILNASTSDMTVDDLTVNGNTILGNASTDTLTANANSWTFANDTNFALSGGVNGLSFDTSTLSIDATNDRVGIGTTSPVSRLDVGGGNIALNGGWLSNDGANEGIWIRSNGAVGIGTNDPDVALEVRSGDIHIRKESPVLRLFDSIGSWEIRADVAGTDMFDIYDFSSSVSRLVIGSTGNVGIGTTSPVGLLQAGTSPSPGLLVTAAGNLGIGTTGPNAKLWVSGGSSGQTSPNTDANDLVVENSGHGGISLLMPDDNNNVLAFGSPSDTIHGSIISHYGGGYMSIGTSKVGSELRLLSGDGARAMTILSTGNVGIGTTGPAAKFEVIGAGTGTGFALRVKDSASADKLAFLDSGKLGIGTTLPAAGLAIGTGTNNNATTADDLYVTRNLEVDGSAWLGDTTADNLTIAGSLNQNAPLTITSTTTPQFSLRYDASNRWDSSVSSAGAVTLDAVGASSGFSFSDNVDATLGLDVSGAALTIANQAITQTTGGQVTFAGNVDASAGLDVTTADLTVGGANFSVAPATGNITTAGDLALNGGDLTSTAASLNIDAGGTIAFKDATLSLTNQATNIDLINATVNALSLETNLLSLDTSNSRVGIGTTSPAGLLQVGTSPSPGLLVTTSGNVGIGTTAPSQKLHVEGQCVTGDTILSIFEKEVQGSRFKVQGIPIKDVKPGMMVYSLNEELGIVEPHRIIALLDMGIKPIFKLTTEDGRAIKTTGNHPYLVKNFLRTEKSAAEKAGFGIEGNIMAGDSEIEGAKWIRVAGLSEGDEIAVAKEELSMGQNKIAHQGDRTSLYDTKKRHYYHEISNEGISEGRRQPFENFSQILRHNNLTFKEGKEYSNLAGPEDEHPADKSCFSLRNLDFQTGFGFHQLLMDISSYFCKPFLKFTLCDFESFVFGAQFHFVKHLNQSFSALVGEFLSKNLWYSNYTHYSSFLAAEKIYHSLKDLSSLFIEVSGKPLKFDQRPQIDFFRALFITPRVEAQEIISSTTAINHNLQGVSSPTFNSSVRLVSRQLPLSSPNILWAKIISIEYIGSEQVYDIEVEGTHNFIANGIIAHNTYISSNLGIGTVSPVGLLQAGTSPSPGLLVTSSGNVGIGTTAPQALLHAGTAPSSGLLVFASGNVGIGTTNPAQKLDIIGNMIASGTIAGNILTGTNVTSGADPGHTHTGTSLSTIDISTDTNLAVTAPVLLTGDTLSLTVAKDIVAGVGLSGGEDNVLPGADADTTLTFDATELTSLTWSAGASALLTHTFDLSGTDPIMTFGSNYVSVSTGNMGVGTTLPVGLLQVGTSPGAGLVVLSSGSVGIGTTGPGAKLEVVPDYSTGNVDAVRISSTGAASGDKFIYIDSDNEWGIGGVRMNTGLLVAELDLSFNAGAGEIRATGANNLILSTDGNDHIVLSPAGTGNVGIGTTGPAEKLEIAGNIKLTGRIRQGSMGDLAEMMPLASCVLNLAKAVLDVPQALIQGKNDKTPLILKNKEEYKKYVFGQPEAGDVVVINEDGGIRRSYAPFATNVIGIISTNPAQILRDDLKNGVPVALSGVLPCKVSAENGSIQPGDLLVSSNTPSHAMKAGKNPPAGTVIAKALGKLDKGVGVIEVMVMMR